MTIVQQQRTTAEDEPELGPRAWELYERLRSEIETPENIGKLIVLDVASGDYEIDETGIASSRRLQERHPGAILYALRIGYEAVAALGGVLERTAPTASKL